MTRLQLDIFIIVIRLLKMILHCIVYPDFREFDSQFDHNVQNLQGDSFLLAENLKARAKQGETNVRTYKEIQALVEKAEKLLPKLVRQHEWIASQCLRAAIVHLKNATQTRRKEADRAAKILFDA